MNKSLSVSALLIFSVLFLACNSKKIAVQETGSEENITYSKPVNFSGNYAGIAPCADCEGIQQFINLSEKGSYSWEQYFLGSQKKSFSSSGKISWDSTFSILELEHPQLKTKSYFKVHESMIFQVDKSGESIKGTSYQNYALDKTDLDLFDKKWIVPLETDDTLRHKPSKFYFIKEEMRIGGTTGCNIINGEFRLMGDNKISFQKIMTTEMACFDASRESAFLLGLYKTTRYQLEKKKLILFDAKGNTTLSLDLNSEE